MKKLTLLLGLLIACIGWIPSHAQADLLAHMSFTVDSGAGKTGLAAQTTDMIMSDGNSWSGGSVGVQGASSFNPTNNPPTAANVSLKFMLGSAVDTLNSTYGAGNWTVANASLTFQNSLYANNTRFGGGPGYFDIYWVGNDNWVQGTSNPVYATSAASLAPWSGSQANLGTKYYSWSTPAVTGSTTDYGTWATDKTGDRQSIISYILALDSLFVNDIKSASATSNSAVSLYLMAGSDTLGMLMFTGGSDVAGGIRPTLSFDVVSAAPVPIPAAAWMLGSGLMGLAGMRRKFFRA